MVETDLRNLKIKISRKKKNIWQTIRNLEKKKGIVIRPADKGGGLVILDENDYKEEMENLVKVEDTYQKLRNNPKKNSTRRN